MHNCRVCEVELDDENWSPSGLKNRNYICRDCSTKYSRAWRKANPDKVKAIRTRGHRKDGQLPMGENKECASYLGVYTAERLLRYFFNDVEVMPYGNQGYDIVCNHGKKIDSKSGCILKNGNGWVFNIDYNIIADYFVCVAFDDREHLTPLHIWMLPGDKFNHLKSVRISPSTIHKWDEYKLSIDKVITCCNEMKAK